MTEDGAETPLRRASNSVPVVAVANGVMSVVEVTGLVNLFTSMLNTSTAQIISRIDSNAAAETERWRKHDAELERNREQVVARFLKVESALDNHLVVANSFFAKEHDEEVASDARVRPVKSAVGWLWLHWRDILLLVIGLFAFMTLVIDAFGHMLGLGVP